MKKERVFFVAYEAEKWWLIKFSGSMLVTSNLVGVDLYKAAQAFIEKEKPGYDILITAFNEIPSE